MRDRIYFKIIGDCLLCVLFGLVLISCTLFLSLNFFFLIYSKGCKTLLRISLLLVKLPLSVSLDVIFLVSQSHKRKVS